MMGIGSVGWSLSRSAPWIRRTERASQDRPNFVFILADDLGYSHLGCYGQEKIRTPHLDRLAGQGMLFTQAYAASSLCAPSRSCLMTGTHTGHTSVRGNSGGIPLLDEDLTIAEVLKEAGYTSGLFGKWGLGDARTSGVPTRQGFDEYYGALDQVHAHFYYPEYLWHNDEKVYLEGNANGRKEQYTNDLFTDKAVEFIERHAEDPFFCYVPYTIPHTELLVPEDSLAEYLGEFEEIPFEYEGHYAGQDHPRAAFAAMVTRMDGYVGRIVEAVQNTGIAENTLVIVSSDNGGQQSGAGVDLDFFDGNAPLRGAKGSLYEGGIRVPTIAWWPGTVDAHTVNNTVWASWDVLPTFAELADVPSPTAIDGLSIVRALLENEHLDRDMLYWELDRRVITIADGTTHPNPEGSLHQAVRMSDWKAVRNDVEGPTELYYLRTDIAEKFDVAHLYPEVVAEAESLFETERVEARPQIEPDSGNDRLYR